MAPCFPNVEAEPCTSGVPVGSHWTFEIYTHCGVEWIYLDGRFWLTEPLGKLNAPTGWGNPIDEGVVTLEASDAASYLSQGGDQVVFTPAAKSFEPPLCQDLGRNGGQAAAVIGREAAAAYR